MNAQTPPIDVRRAYRHVALGRFGSVAGLVSAMALLAVDCGDWWARSYAALWLVTSVWDARKTARPIARVDEGGMTYADGLMTRRVGFADVLAWEHDAEGLALLITTRDGSAWGVNLAEADATDRERVLAHLAAYLPPASIRARWGRTSSPFLRQGLTELALLTVLVLATTHVIGVATALRGVLPESSRADPATAVAWRSEYGPRAKAYAMPPPPQVELPLRFDRYSGPWEFPNCHIEALVGVCVVRDS